MDFMKNEKLADDLFENTFSMILLFNKEGRIIKSNKVAKTQLGYEEKDRSVWITDIFRREFEKTEEGIRYVPDETINRVAYRKNETCFPVELRVIIEEGQKDFFGICIALNMTQRIEAMKDIEKAKEETGLAMQIRNEFVSNVTHELRTPVNGIKGITSTLKETSLTKEQKSLLSIIENCCENMSTIINDLLDFSKLEAGKFSLEEREFSFRDFMDKAVETSLSAINEKGLKLRVSISPDIPEYVVGDALRLTQIINNLLSNSTKFTNVGQISIEVTKTEENEEGIIELFFMVMDTGIGIAREEMDKLFKSFSQVDATITRKFGGTGLGLSITKQLVELMNGTIFVDSEKGKGSTFSFSVRLRKADREENRNQESISGSYIYDDLRKKSVVNFSKEGAMQLAFLEGRQNAYDMGTLFKFGSEENKKEISRIMDKLILCIEMDNWEKAEEFAKVVKTLIGDENPELRKSVFRLELSIRKETKDKSKLLYETLERSLGESFED